VKPYFRDKKIRLSFFKKEYNDLSSLENYDQNVGNQIPNYEIGYLTQPNSMLQYIVLDVCLVMGWLKSIFDKWIDYV
jgi:hypothetical protein